MEVELPKRLSLVSSAASMPNADPTPPSPRPGTPTEYPLASAAAEDAAVRAFEALVRAHYARLCAFAARFVDSRDAAEDVVQDVFVRLWKTRPELDLEFPLRYLYHAVRNEATTYHRRRATRERAASSIRDQRAIDGDRVEPDGVQMVEHADLAVAVAEAVAALPERCRLVFTLNRERGLSYSQIAKTLGVSVKTVETQMSRALRGLRAHLAKYMVLAAVSIRLIS